MNHLSKIVTVGKLAPQLVEAHRHEKSVVFTNGCFDILHAGHVRYLTAAAREGDLLVVGLNSDESVRSLKGDQRPVIGQKWRAEVLAGLGCVDYVIVFDAPDPLELIQSLQPDILVKGADWAEEDIIGADFVTARGGRVVRISLVAEVSTTQIIQKILELYRRG